MSKPVVNVQWKGTTVCLDFQCECSDEADAFEFHLDHDYLSTRCIKCPRCGSVWRLGNPPVEKVGPGDPDWDWVKDSPVVDDETWRP